MREGGRWVGSGPISCEVYNRAVLHVPRRCVRADAGSGPNSREGSGRVLTHVRCIIVRSCTSREVV